MKYCAALQNLGLKLVWLDRDDALPDSCFVEDTAVILGEKAIICNMKVESRIREVIAVAEVLKKIKETYYIKPPATIDGGDVLKIEEKILVGLSVRTNLQAIKQLERFLENSDFEVVPVKVHDVLHLKSACTCLGKNYVIFSKGHFDMENLRDYNKIIVFLDVAVNFTPSRFTPLGVFWKIPYPHTFGL